MREIESALLAGQKKVFIAGIEVGLPTLARDTQKCREREARQKANELMKVLNS